MRMLAGVVPAATMATECGAPSVSIVSPKPGEVLRGRPEGPDHAVITFQGSPSGLSYTGQLDFTCIQLVSGNVRCWGWGGVLGYAHMGFIGDDEVPAVAGDVVVGF
jgi:hypothetical protein